MYRNITPLGKKRYGYTRKIDGPHGNVHNKCGKSAAPKLIWSQCKKHEVTHKYSAV